MHLYRLLRQTRCKTVLHRLGIPHLQKMYTGSSEVSGADTSDDEVEVPGSADDVCGASLPEHPTNRQAIRDICKKAADYLFHNFLLIVSIILIVAESTHLESKKYGR